MIGFSIEELTGHHAVDAPDIAPRIAKTGKLADARQARPEVAQARASQCGDRGGVPEAPSGDHAGNERLDPVLDQGGI